MAVDKEKLAEMMGEKNIVRPPQQRYPIIKLNGQKGIFTRADIGKDGYEKPKEVGQIVEGEIIAVRRQLSEFNKNYTRSSNEFDNLTDEVIIWESGNEVFKGNYQDARKAFQTMRSRYHLYVLIGGEIVKVVVKGAGLGNLFEYFNDLKQANLHIFEVKTRIEPAQETGDLGVYFVTVFTNGGPVSDEHLGEVALKLQTFHETLKELRAAYQKDAVQPVVDEIPPDDIPVIDLDDEEIKPEDIPF